MKKVEVESFTDKAGQVVKRGDYIAYGRIYLQSGDLNFAKVVNIKCCEGYRPNQKFWAITIVALEEKIVRPLDSEDFKWETVAMEKKITLQYPERTIKFDNLPQNYKNLLDSV